MQLFKLSRNNLFKITLLLLFSICLLTAASDYYGDQYLKTANYQEALKHYQVAWRHNPENIIIKKRLELCQQLIKGEEAFTVGNYDQALAIFNNTPAKYQPVKKLQQTKAALKQITKINQAKSSGNYRKALRHCSQLLSINSLDEHYIQEEETLEKLLAIQNEYQKLLAIGNWKAAYKKLATIFKITNNSLYVEELDILNNLKNENEYLEYGRYQELLNNYNMLLVKNQDNQYLENKLKNITKLIYLEKKGDYTFNNQDIHEALNYYQQALKINSRSKTLEKKYLQSQKFKNYLLSGLNAFDHQDYQKALSFFKKNQEINSDNYQNNEFIFVCKTIIAGQEENDPRFATAIINKLGKYENIRDYIIEEIKKNPLEKEIYISQTIVQSRQRGLAAFAVSDYPTAKQYFSKVLAYHRADKVALNYYLKSKRCEEYLTAIKKDIKENNLTQAIKKYKKLKNLNPQEISLGYLLRAGQKAQ